MGRLLYFCQKLNATGYYQQRHQLLMIPIPLYPTHSLRVVEDLDWASEDLLEDCLGTILALRYSYTKILC